MKLNTHLDLVLHAVVLSTGYVFMTWCLL